MTRQQRIAADAAKQEKLFGGDLETGIKDDPAFRNQVYALNVKTRNAAVERARAQPDEYLLATYQQDPGRLGCITHVCAGGFRFTFCGMLIPARPLGRRPCSFNQLQLNFCKLCLKHLGVDTK